MTKDERWCSTCHGNGSFTAPYDGNCPEPHGKERLRSLQGERPTGDYKQAEATASKDSRSESPAPILPSSKPQFIGENGPMTSGDCARWLEAKYARHHELEDKASAELIRWQAQEIARLTAMTRGAVETSEERVKIWCATCGEFGAHAPGCRRGVDDQEIAEGLGIARNSGRLPEEPSGKDWTLVTCEKHGRIHATWAGCSMCNAEKASGRYSCGMQGCPGDHPDLATFCPAGDDDK